MASRESIARVRPNSRRAGIEKRDAKAETFPVHLIRTLRSRTQPLIGMEIFHDREVRASCWRVPNWTPRFLVRDSADLTDLPPNESDKKQRRAWPD